MTAVNLGSVCLSSYPVEMGSIERRSRILAVLVGGETQPLRPSDVAGAVAEPVEQVQTRDPREREAIELVALVVSELADALRRRLRELLADAVHRIAAGAHRILTRHHTALVLIALPREASRIGALVVVGIGAGRVVRHGGVVLITETRAVASGRRALVAGVGAGLAVGQHVTLLADAQRAPGLRAGVAVMSVHGVLSWAGTWS